jgi:hypothetical protein
VTGLGLLHHRFGYNSIWLALVAPVQDMSHDGRLIAVGSTIACTLLAFQIVHSAARILAAVARPADWFIVAAPLPGALSSWLLSAMISSSPDIPVWILTILLGWTLLADRDRELAPVALLLAVGAAAIKVSAAPLVIGALVYAAWTRQLGPRGVLAIGLFGTATLGAVVSANVVTSGCLMFPAAVTCLPVSWAISPETATAVTQFISHWPLFENINEFNATDIMSYANGSFAVLPLPERLRLILAGAHPLSWALLATIIGLAGLALRSSFSRASGVTFLVGIGGLLYCISVPSYRFAAGWIGLLTGLAMIAVIDRLSRWSRLGLSERGLALCRAPGGILFGALAGAVVGAALSSIDRMGDRDLRESGFADRPTSITRRWLLPPTLVAHQFSPAKGMISGTRFPRSEPTRWVETRTGEVTYLHPQSGEQCWGIRQACTPPGEPFHPFALRSAEQGISAGLARVPEPIQAARHDRGDVPSP